MPIDDQQTLVVVFVNVQVRQVRVPGMRLIEWTSHEGPALMVEGKTTSRLKPAFRMAIGMLLVAVARRILRILLNSGHQIGLVRGRLRPCPNSPNCVCSQDQAVDAEHHIEPLAFTGPPRVTWQRMHDLLVTLPRTRVVSHDESYLHVEFTTLIMRFVDDVEFQLDETASVIHIRSASRIGHSDLGANRKRVEAIRQKFEATLPTTPAS